ncbi:MAG: hypothetical protein EA359_06205 [Balneolaceae bacterium]|nr:MAG: hypothetical protein EA359_06205 [Balneolaceae bacterium]
MARIYLLTLSFLLLLPFFIAQDAEAQSTRYELLPSPDLWYNDVDGIRVGLRLKGQVPGTFEDGPHRLDAGVWLGLWFPKVPVSYYMSFTEPIQSWSEYGSEASIQFISSIRTGYHNHGVGFSKRWQQGFDERRYREAEIYNSFEKRFDHEYTPFPLLWSDQDKFLTSASFEIQDDHSLGWYTIRADASMQYLEEAFSLAAITAHQRTDLHEFWGIRLRVFAGISSSNTTPEYLFSRSIRPAAQWMGNGFTRAKGTIPTSWMHSGNIQVAGGANVRGYTNRDIDSFKPCQNGEADGGCSTEPFLFNNVLALNAEFDYWNPVAVAFNKIPYISEFLSFRSYLFFDTGTSFETTVNDTSTSFSNAGAGFSLSLNIPDYHGKPRGFVLRYEIPFWLSDPGDEDSFKLRHLMGFGAVISF